MMKNDRKILIDSLNLNPKYADVVKNGCKKSTIRIGYIFINDIELPLYFGNVKFNKNVLIEKIDYSKTFESLNEKDAINDGFENLDELKYDLKLYYPEIGQKSHCTIIYFSIIE